MTKFYFVVGVEAETEGLAFNVMSERIYYEEDYGYFYKIWVEPKDSPIRVHQHVTVSDGDSE